MTDYSEYEWHPFGDVVFVSRNNRETPDAVGVPRLLSAQTLPPKPVEPDPEQYLQHPKHVVRRDRNGDSYCLGCRWTTLRRQIKEAEENES